MYLVFMGKYRFSSIESLFSEVQKHRRCVIEVYRILNDFGKKKGKIWAGITGVRRIQWKIAGASAYRF